MGKRGQEDLTPGEKVRNFLLKGKLQMTEKRARKPGRQKAPRHEKLHNESSS